MSWRAGAGLAFGNGGVDGFAEAAARAAMGLGGGPCQVALVFAGEENLDHAEEGLAAVHERLHPQALVGCGAQGVVGVREGARGRRRGRLGRVAARGRGRAVPRRGWPDGGGRGGGGRSGLRRRRRGHPARGPLQLPGGAAAQPAVGHPPEPVRGRRHGERVRPAYRRRGRLRRRRGRGAARRQRAHLRLAGRPAGRPGDDGDGGGGKRDRGAGLRAGARTRAARARASWRRRSSSRQRAGCSWAS